MIISRRGDILTSRAAYVVIPTNAMGVMGAGLAKQAAQRWPNLHGAYSAWCLGRRMSGGECLVFNAEDDSVERNVVCFMTKEHWKNKSRLEWIESGLGFLRHMACRGRTLAVPMLGCGLGGLPEHIVERMIYDHLDDVTAPVELWRN